MKIRSLLLVLFLVLVVAFVALNLEQILQPTSLNLGLATIQAPLGLAMLSLLALALLVQSRIRGIRLFRTIFYLPTVLAGVAFVVVWLWMLDPRGGLVNLLLARFGIVGPRWLLDPDWALPALILMSF